MRAATASIKLTEIEAELRGLAGRCDRGTVAGRRNHNRRSALYGRRRRMLAIIALETKKHLGATEH